MSATASVPELLGLRKHPARPGSALGIMSDVEKGLPLSALDRVVQVVAPDDSGFAYRLVPRATLARRRAQHTPRLTPEESGRVGAGRLGLGICQGGMEERAKQRAGGWFEPHMMLEDRRSDRCRHRPANSAGRWLKAFSAG